MPISMSHGIRDSYGTQLGLARGSESKAYLISVYFKYNECISWNLCSNSCHGLNGCQQPMKDMFCEFSGTCISMRHNGTTKYFELVVLCNFSFFDFDFNKKQHDLFDYQQLNTATNHIHYPKSYTLEYATWVCIWNVISQLPLLLLMDIHVTDIHVTTAIHHHLYSHS